MSVEVRYGADVARPYENIFFREFAETIKNKFERSGIDALLLGMPYCTRDDRLQIDALLVTKSKIVIIEFKNYCGTITFRDENSIKSHAWRVNDGDNTVTVNHNNKNPFKQTCRQRNKLKERFAEIDFEYSSEDINVMVCFQREVNVLGVKLPLGSTPWFFVCDCTNYSSTLFDIVSTERDNSYLSADSKEKLLRLFRTNPYKIKDDTGENQDLVRNADAKLLEQLCSKLSRCEEDLLSLYCKLFGKKGNKRSQFVNASTTQTEIARQIIAAFGLNNIACKGVTEPELTVDDSKKVFDKLKQLVSDYGARDKAETLHRLVTNSKMKSWAGYAKEGSVKNFFNEVSIILSKVEENDGDVTIEDAWALAFLGAIVGPGSALTYSQDQLTETSLVNNTFLREVNSSMAKKVWSLKIIGRCNNGLDEILKTFDLPTQTKCLKIGRPVDLTLCYKEPRQAALEAKVEDDTLFIPLNVISRSHAQLKFRQSTFSIENLSTREQSTAVMRCDGGSLVVGQEEIRTGQTAEDLKSGSIVLLVPRAFPNDQIKGFAIRVVEQNG